MGYCAIKTRDDPETSDNEQHRPPTPSAAALAPAAVGSTYRACHGRLTIGGRTASHARSTAARTAIAMMVALATANARATQGNQLFSHFGRRYASHATEHCVRWLCLSSTHGGCGGQLSLGARSSARCGMTAIERRPYCGFLPAVMVATRAMSVTRATLNAQRPPAKYDPQLVRAHTQ